MKEFKLSFFDVNCYVLNYQGECYLIDAGEFKKEILEEINKYDCKGILLTHGHLDHINAISDYNLPIYIHEDDYNNLFDDSLSLYHFFSFKKNFNANKLYINKLKDNDKIKLGDDYIKVIHTPGHTKGSVCYLFKNKLFSGDTLFKLGIGRTDLPGGNLKDIKKSIVNLIDELDDNILVYPGHEENTTIKNERKNPYYKLYKKSLTK